MQLPEELKNHLDELALNVPLSEWTRAFQQLSDLYRNKIQGSVTERLASDRLRVAYLHVRMPATYAALVQVLQEVIARLPEMAIETMADIGSGPGTGLFAAERVFASL